MFLKHATKNLDKSKFGPLLNLCNRYSASDLKSEFSTTDNESLFAKVISYIKKLKWGSGRKNDEYKSKLLHEISKSNSELS